MKTTTARTLEAALTAAKNAGTDLRTAGDLWIDEGVESGRLSPREAREFEAMLDSLLG